MPTRKVLKKQAKALILSNYGKALKLNILPVLGILLFGFILGIGLIYWVDGQIYFSAVDENTTSNLTDNFFARVMIKLVITMFMTGIMYQMLDWFRSGNKDFKFKDLFTGFRREYVFGLFVLYCIQFIFITLWTFALIIPGIIKRYSYSQSYYIYKDCVDNDQTSTNSFADYVTMSRQLMDGHKAELFILELSFIGWFILVLLTFGLASFWVIPYYNATMVAYYDNLRKETI